MKSKYTFSLRQYYILSLNYSYINFNYFRIFSLPENIKKKVKIDVNTVDGFQGQECDIIIMSCVRSQKIGFLSDRQRLCVALTRAKRSLIMCGNFNIFMVRLYNNLQKKILKN